MSKALMVFVLLDSIPTCTVYMLRGAMFVLYLIFFLADDLQTSF